MTSGSVPFDDPFASPASGRTFVKPNPGGLGGRGAPPPTGSWKAGAPEATTDHGLTPLLALANRLLMLVPQLRQTRHVVQPGNLRAELAQGIRDFESQAREQGIAPERVMAARYVLCTTLDEAAADTPWGGGGVWSRYSLLTEFHNEAFGGEKVFQLMARLAEKPDANRDLLELIYAALALGFEGRFRVQPNGRQELEQVRAKLAQMIQRARGPYPAALADHWAAAPVAQRQVLSWLPLAAVSALVLLMLGGGYMAWLMWLSGHADPVYGRIQGLRLPPPVAAVAQPAAKPRLKVFLQADERAGLVSVRDDVDRSLVTLLGDGLFDSGSATLSVDREALLQRVAQALVRVGGQVQVTGHTDDMPVRTPRFPSNWHLSDERAQTVGKLLLRHGLPPDRLRTEGRADGEPLAPNNSAENRRRNRRVEITLFTHAAPLARPMAAPASR